jgi:hypothetical protein
MTNKGVFTGRGYDESIEKYRICEGTYKIELFIKQNVMYGFNGAAHAPAASHGPISKTTVWNCFTYNEQDKLPIFKILVQWEQEQGDSLTRG